MLVVGSDNLPAANNVERVFYVFMLILGAVLYAFIVSVPLCYPVATHLELCPVIVSSGSLVLRFRVSGFS